MLSLLKLINEAEAEVPEEELESEETEQQSGQPQSLVDRIFSK